MRKTITFEPPVIIDENGTKITVESVSGRIVIGSNGARFIPDVAGLDHYIKFEVPQEQEQAIVQAVEAVTVRRAEPKSEIIEESDEGVRK